jgi:hypothetical protein
MPLNAGGPGHKQGVGGQAGGNKQIVNERWIRPCRDHSRYRLLGLTYYGYKQVVNLEQP